MLRCNVVILAFVLATAAAWPPRGQDTLDDWFAPFFESDMLDRPVYAPAHTVIHTHLHMMERTVWPSLEDREKTLIVATANKLKPIILKHVNTAGRLFNRFNETEFPIVEKFNNFSRNAELLERVQTNLMRNIAVGDFNSANILFDKVYREYEGVINDKKLQLTQEERAKLLSIVNDVMAVSKDTYIGLKTVFNSLTIEDILILKGAYEKFESSGQMPSLSLSFIS